MKPRKKTRCFFQKLQVDKDYAILTRSIQASTCADIFLILSRKSVKREEYTTLNTLKKYIHSHFSRTQADEICLFPSFIMMLTKRSAAVVQKYLGKRSMRTLQDLIDCAEQTGETLHLKSNFKICVPYKN
jgi:hypothetical protein